VVEVEERLRLELGQIAPLNDDGRDWQMDFGLHYTRAR